jgi:hypothetical protein
MQFLRSASYHHSAPRFPHSGSFLWSNARVMRNMLLRCDSLGHDYCPGLFKSFTQWFAMASNLVFN